MREELSFRRCFPSAEQAEESCSVAVLHEAPAL